MPMGAIVKSCMKSSYESASLNSPHLEFQLPYWIFIFDRTHSYNVISDELINEIAKYHDIGSDLDSAFVELGID